MLLNVSIPQAMADALTQATQGGLLTIADYVRLGLHRVLIQDGFYKPTPTAPNGGGNHQQAA